MIGRQGLLRTQRGRTSLSLSLLLAASLAGCGDEGRSPSGLDFEVAPVGVAVSEPVGGAEATAALAAGAQGLVYVSADPGTFPDAVSATVANSAIRESVTAQIAEGGFDPVAISGSPGDELEISVHYGDGTAVRYRSIVPARKRPRVVRTRPPKDAVGVPLNANIVVVFSEPVEAATVTLESVGLLLDGAPLAAILRLDDIGLQVELVPDLPLEPGTTYTLEVTSDIHDLTGDALEEAVTLSFRTQAALGNQIVFWSYSQQDWGNGIYDSEIFVVNTDGSGLVNLTNHPAWDGSPAVSPNGKRILFVSNRDGNDEIYVMNADGSGLVNLTHHAAPDADPVWSPDGAKIAFVSYRDSNGQNGCTGGTSTVLWPCPDIFVMNSDGSNPVNLTNRPTDEDGWPAWSPDGTKIAFASNSGEPDSVPGSRNYEDIFVMNADGSNVVKLTDIEGPMLYAYWPAWSPDGTKIAFTGGPGTAGIWVMNANGSNPVRLTAGEHSVYNEGVWPSWSPDGAWIAFRAVPSCELFQQCANREVFVMDADGSNAVKVTNRPGFNNMIGSPQAWSPPR